jgi:hypothetical protein
VSLREREKFIVTLKFQVGRWSEWIRNLRKVWKLGFVDAAFEVPKEQLGMQIWGMDMVPWLVGDMRSSA